MSPYIVDWTGLSTSILDSQVFTTTMEYDALNRAMKVTYPEDVNGNRKELTPTYNRAGVLHKVSFDGTEYIKEIAYNAKGQPLLTAYGNSMMTRFVYDENTFRTVRLKTEKYAYTTPLGVHTYTPQSGTTKQDFAYEYDLIGNIMKLHDRTPDSGIQGSILGTDALDRLFNYDPLYRVIAANGRESTNQNPNILWGDVLPAGTPNANNCQAYNQLFTYDKLGNMMQLQQTGTNAYTRQYVYSSYSTNNKLSQINNGVPVPTVYSNFTYDVNGNMTQSDTDRKYIWDAADQLRVFYIQAGTSEPSVYAQYLYSGGSRSKKIVRTSGGDYEVTVYDGPFEYCKKVSGLTTYEKNYSHVEGVEIRTGTAFPGDISDSIVYQLPDHLGSSNVRLSTTGTIIDKEEYYPFGDTSLRTFTYKRYRYVGKEKDSESGLYYYGARYYASWTCRFISVDPLAAKYAHLTPYNYAGNKPINSIDVNGMEGNNPTDTTTPTAGNGSSSGLTPQKVTDAQPVQLQNSNQGSYTWSEEPKTVNNYTAPPVNTDPVASQPKYHAEGKFNEKNNSHTVERGNTLWNLSKRYGVSVGDIVVANGMKSEKDVIVPGQKLKIEKGAAMAAYLKAKKEYEIAKANAQNAEERLDGISLNSSAPNTPQPQSTSPGNGSDYNFLYNIQEVNVGAKADIKIGPISISLGPEIAVGNSNAGLDFSGRFNFSISGDLKKFLNPKEWRGTGVTAGVYAGWASSPSPTLFSGVKTGYSTYEKTTVTVGGNGYESKSSISNTGVISQKVGINVGIKGDIGPNRTTGMEWKFTGSSLWRDTGPSRSWQ